MKTIGKLVSDERSFFLIREKILDEAALYLLETL